MIKVLYSAALFIALSAPALAIDTIDIIFDSKVDSMKEAGLGAVIYPHKRHEELYECDVCHPKIFIDKKGSNDINMQKNMTEQYCGYAGCHNSPYAFPLFLCDYCHEVLPTAKGK